MIREENVPPDWEQTSQAAVAERFEKAAGFEISAKVATAAT